MVFLLSIDKVTLCDIVTSNKLFDMEIKYLFTYGSLILDQSKVKLHPLESVFLRGYKLVVEKSPITQTNYHYILLEETKIDSDIIPGYLAEVNDEILERLDKFEGKSYRRIIVTVFTRQLKPIEAYVYIKNN